MREAVGGTVLFYIILGFLAIFIVFIAVIMNYAAAYRTSNYVINIIEQTEGQTEYANLVEYLRKNNYNNGLEVSCSHNAKGSVFHVKTYVTFHIPIIFREGEGLKLAINNDTKTIFKMYNGKYCNSASDVGLSTCSDDNYPSVGGCSSQ